MRAEERLVFTGDNPTVRSIQQWHIRCWIFIGVSFTRLYYKLRREIPAAHSGQGISNRACQQVGVKGSQTDEAWSSRAIEGSSPSGCQIGFKE